MDTRTRQAWVEAQANPGDEVAQERLENMVRRGYVAQEDQFQADLAPGGRLTKALSWEMEYSRIGVQTKDDGGLVSAAPTYGNRWVHVRVWYPTFEEVLENLTPDDVRISVSAHYSIVGDVIETLEGYFGAATIVSSGVANIDPDGYKGWRDMAKPKRADLIDTRKVQEAEIAERSTRHRGWGDNTWVA